MTFLVALDLLAITTALDEIHRDLDVSARALPWTVTGYSVAFASLLLTGSALGERYGRRRMSHSDSRSSVLARPPT